MTKLRSRWHKQTVQGDELGCQAQGKSVSYYYTQSPPTKSGNVYVAVIPKLIEDPAAEGFYDIDNSVQIRRRLTDRKHV